MMNATNQLLGQLVENGTIDLNDFYSCSIGRHKTIQLQGEYSPKLVKSLNETLKNFSVEKEIKANGYISMIFSTNGTEISITLTD
jgi:hypothetical protein